MTSEQNRLLIAVRSGSNEIRHADVAALELQAARRALALLKELISNEQMLELLETRIAEGDEYLRDLAQRSKGKFGQSAVELDIEGLSADDFITWFRNSSLKSDRKMLAAHPEHYEMATGLENSSNHRVVETFAGEGRYYLGRLYIEFSDPSVAPVPPDPGFHQFISGIVRLEDGTEFARVLHQFQNTETGMIARLAVFFPAASPDELILGHERHLRVEFTNWITAAKADVAHGS